MGGKSFEEAKMHQPAVRRGGARFLAGTVVSAALAIALSGPVTGAPAAAAVWTSKTAGLEVRGVESLRIAPKGPDVMYASVFSGRDAAARRGFCESRDKGKTWTALRAGLEDPLSQRDHYEITLDPKDEKVLYVVWRGKIFRSTDAGSKFERADNGTTTFSTDRSQSRGWIAGVVVDPSNNKRLLAGTRVVGYDGGRIAAERLADHVVVTRSEHIPRIQEAQASAYHVLRELVEVP
jgi:hypothetical protein